MSIVSNNIKYLRRTKGLTQEQFARKIGIKRSLLGAYEEGRANPNYENLMNMANFFGQSVDILMKNDIRKQNEMNNNLTVLNTFREDEIKAPASLEDLLNDLNKETQSRENYNVFNPVADTFPNSTFEEPSQFSSINKNFISPEPQISNGFETQKNNFSYQKYSEASDSDPVLIEYISQKNIQNYLNNISSSDFLKQLPLIQLPMLKKGIYRAFEAGNDFPLPESTIIGSAVKNWVDIKDGIPYIIIAQKRGILFRRVFNQVKIKGTLLLSSDNSSFPTIEINIKEVLEAWELKMFFSSQLPEPSQYMPAIERLSKLVYEMQQEIKDINN